MASYTPLLSWQADIHVIHYQIDSYVNAVPTRLKLWDIWIEYLKEFFGADFQCIEPIIAVEARVKGLKEKYGHNNELRENFNTIIRRKFYHHRSKSELRYMRKYLEMHNGTMEQLRRMEFEYVLKKYEWRPTQQEFREYFKEKFSYLDSLIYSWDSLDTNIFLGNDKYV